MIIGIGTDIVQHKITELLKWDTDIEIQTRLFSNAEISLCSQANVVQFLSGRYAAKEAILKCLGIGMIDGISMPDIEILQDEAKKPLIQLKGSVLEIAKQLSIQKWHISISHSPDYSLAFVIAEG